MANTAYNNIGVMIKDTQSITGSFSGFTVVSGSAVFAALKDYAGTLLSTGSTGVQWTLPVGTTFVPLYITSASLSAGGIVLYPITTVTPQQ